MSESSKLIVGTRGSNLALIQTNMVIEALKAIHPELNIEIKVITTKGDTDHSPIPLDTIGKAWFTKEIEDALLSSEIDLAVHSLKDLLPETPAGLMVAPVLERADPRDVLISRLEGCLKELPQDAVIGTDSIRRKAGLLQRRPDLIVKSVRGNVDTRLRKLEDKEYDGLMLAAAGLDRLGKSKVISEYLDPAEFVPAIGQGVLAVEARKNHTELWRLIAKMQDVEVLAAVAAEQAFSEVIGGGCKLPVGCYVHFEDNQATVHGMIGSMDAKRSVTAARNGSKQDAIAIARSLAEEFLRDNGDLVKGLRS